MRSRPAQRPERRSSLDVGRVVQAAQPIDLAVGHPDVRAEVSLNNCERTELVAGDVTEFAPGVRRDRAVGDAANNVCFFPTVEGCLGSEGDRFISGVDSFGCVRVGALVVTEEGADLLAGSQRYARDGCPGLRGSHSRPEGRVSSRKLGTSTHVNFLFVSRARRAPRAEIRCWQYSSIRHWHRPKSVAAVSTGLSLNRS